MGEVMAIASSLWKRVLGMRVIYFLIFSAIALIAITNLYDILMVKEERALMVDSAMFLTTLAGMLAVLSLAFDIPKELNSGVASVLLSKPLGRTQYLIGKLIGISWIGVVITGIISIGFFIVYSFSYGKVPVELVKGSCLIVLSVIPMASIVLLFSSFLSEVAAAIASAIAIWFCYSVSHLADVPVMKLLYGSVLPDLSLFNMGAEAYYGLSIGSNYIFWAVLFSLFTAVTYTIVASFIFNARDI